MLRAMETETDTDLLPFRVVHQVTEVVAGVANTLACEAATRLLTAAADRPLDPALRAITLTNRLLTAADESIKLMQRALTPNAYSSVRPNLGMVRGTSSMVLRKTLFNSTYPLLVRAFKLRLMEFSGEQAGNEDGAYERAREILRDVEGHNALRGLLQQLVIFHQHVRTWRDNHIQLPKTHLGVSDPADPPTVSLSGSDGAVDIAHELRKTHEADPIVPLYRALLGTAPPAVHEVLAPGEFDDYMARATAREVFDVYSEVQERFYRRCPMRHAAGT
jgi:hypothetical protein